MKNKKNEETIKKRNNDFTEEGVEVSFTLESNKIR